MKLKNVLPMLLIIESTLAFSQTQPNSFPTSAGSNATIGGKNQIEFGAGFTKEPNAGKIGYQTFSGDALDIVGAGTSFSNRKIRLFAEGGTFFNGSIGLTFNLDIATSGDYQGLQLSHTSGRWTRLYSSMPGGSFNGITGINDSGIIFGNNAGTLNTGFVIAPHQGALSGLRVDQNGNVGIGTSSPDAKLAVNGNISFTGGSGSLSSNRSPINGYTNLFLGGAIADQANGSYKVFTDGGSNFFSAIKMDNWGGNVGAIKFYSGQSTGGTSYNISNAELENYARMTIVNGNVGIGTTDPKGYKLAVAGKAIAEEVTVKLQANWPDYVFEPTYQLSPLDSIKTYIDKNKHLPEVPSAKEMEKNGVNLGEMNMLLLKKIEELTLYVIEAKKENEVLRTRVEKLESKK
jgi:hypothetical protein